LLATSLIVAAVVVGCAGISLGAATGDVVIFHAGSLTVPFEEMENRFEAMYSGVDILREAAGSVACARKITELHKPCDIMASADYTVIDEFLIPGYATWNTLFASNQLVLCYTENSKFADTVSSDNWYEVLQREGVIWGHSDPNLDPCGYRSLMVLQLAELYYDVPGLYQKCIDNRPIENVRPKSVELVSLLQTGNMDYAFEYRSVAVQHGLDFVSFPPAINLGSADEAEFYKQAVVDIAGSEPGETTRLYGKPVVYGLTLINDAPNQEAAVAFLEYLLSDEGGLTILEEMGQPPLYPPVVESEDIRDELPESLRDLVGVKG
jgi:molybdate/tungstate transport system substrate-binding protein